MSTPTTRRPARGWSVRVLVAGALALLGVFAMAAGPAPAHAELESSTPQDGATIAEVPDQVEFEFGEDLIAEGSALTAVSLNSGNSVTLTTTDVTGHTITAAWPAGTPSGRYEVSYRVVSADGHPVSGSITFTIDLPVGGPSATIGSATDAPSPSGSGPAQSGSTAPSASPTASEEPDDGSSLLAWIIGLTIVVALGAAAGMWVMRRGRRL